MLSHKPWKLEAVLFLFAGVLGSVFVGMLAMLAFNKLFPGVRAPDREFTQFMIGAVSFQCVPLVLTHFFLKQHGTSWAEFMGLRSAHVGGMLIRSVLVALLVLPVALALAEYSAEVLTAIRSKPPEPQPSMQILKISYTLPKRIIFGFGAIVLAPIAEEILFRGVLYAAIREAGWPRLALWGSSFVFAAIHGSLMTLVPLMFFALILVLLYVRTGGLLAPIVAHATFNAANMFIYFVMGRGAGG